MYYVYVLYSLKDNRLYVGFSSDLKIRIKEHNEGRVSATKHRLPVRLLYYEAYLSKKDATKREYFLKRGRGRELLHDLLHNSFREVRE